MKWLVYDGPHLEVEVPHDNVAGGVIVAGRGKPVEVPDDIADSLLTHGEETGVPVDPETGKPERTPQHARTWRAATAKETKAAEGTAPAADTAEEVSE